MHPSKTLGKRTLILAGIFIVCNLYNLLEPMRSPEDKAAQALTRILHPGDSIGIQNATLGRYSFYSYLPTQNVSLTVCTGNQTNPCDGRWPTFILGRTKVNSQQYELIGESFINLFPFGHGAVIYTYMNTMNGLSRFDRLDCSPLGHIPREEC